jgi:hypothetical protein
MRADVMWVAFHSGLDVVMYVLAALFLLRLLVEARGRGFELSPAGAILRRSARPDELDRGDLDVLVDNAPGCNGQVPRRGERFPTDYGGIVNTGQAMPADGTFEGLGGRPAGPGPGYEPPPGWRGCGPC